MGDVSDPQQQQAATTIQAAVRGQQVREEAKEDTAVEDAAKEDEAATRIQAAYRGYEARKRVNLLKCVLTLALYSFVSLLVCLSSHGRVCGMGYCTVTLAISQILICKWPTINYDLSDFALWLSFVLQLCDFMQQVEVATLQS